MKFEDLTKRLDEDIIEEEWSSIGPMDKFLNTLKIALGKKGANLNIKARAMRDGTIDYSIDQED